MTTPPPARRHPQNFVAHLQALARERAGEAWMVVADGAGERAIEYGAFELRVRALAARLQQEAAPGERALVMLDNDELYAIGMLACFYAGVIAVPVFPPESARPQHLDRLRVIAGDAQATCVLSSNALMAAAPGGGLFGTMQAIAVDAVDDALAQAWRSHMPQDGDIAFLQYTSGSTSAPKGVIVTHGSLMANEQAIQHSMGISAEDKFVCWSPLYHDMGLIGGLLQPLYSGIPLVLTSPGHFLERPVRWLELIARHRATISGGPDFAYRLCLERVKDSQLAQLDLSSWRVAYTGAEPVRCDTMTEFQRRFAVAGFDPAAVYPCYGLAEATLFVTGGRRGGGMLARGFCAEDLAAGLGEPPEEGCEGTLLVGCGAPPPGHLLAIVDPATQSPAHDGRVGEIWASGPSLGRGYWARERETRESFVEHEGRRWLRTGDLGFVREGQLYVTGRIKDLIVIRGHNLYPQDIERTIEAEVDAVRKGRIAAFAVEGPSGEGIGVAVEVSRSMQKLVPPQTLVDALGAAVSEVFGEPLSVVLLLNPGALPKTSSGKLQRSACRQGWAERSLAAYGVFEWGRFVVGSGLQAAEPAPPRDVLESALAAIWQQVLRRDAQQPLARDTHFFASGGNSLAAVQVAGRIAEHWAIDFPVRALFEAPRLSDCAAALRERLAGGATPGVQRIPVLDAQDRAAVRPLSRAQQRQWFLWHLDRSSTAHHVAGAWRLGGMLQPDALRCALDGLVERHASLRTVFPAAADGNGVQRILDGLRVALPLIDLGEAAPGNREAREAEAIRAIHAQPFDLVHGPLLRAALVRLAPQLHTLVLVMHHIVSDASSMQILIDELGLRYGAALAGEPLVVPAPALQYVDYAAWQDGWLAEGERERQLAYWRAELGDGSASLALPTDHPRQALAGHRAGQHAFELPAALLRDLERAARRHDCTVFMVLLAGLQVLLYRHGGQEDIRIGVPVANRHHAQTQGVVGFFVNTQVQRNSLHGRMHLAQVLAQVRRAALDAQANQDLPFEQLVEALQPGRALGHTPLFQVLFNHFREDYRVLERHSGLSVAPLPVEVQAVEFELAVEVRERVQGRALVLLRYAAALFNPATIERFGAHYLRVLQALAAQPQAAIADLPLLDEAERSTLAAWGRHAPLGAPDCTLHALFEQQARARPEATALVFGEEAMRYGELNARANRLARHLIALGVRPEARVGISMERGLDMVVALLAILKAGGAYVPLDPDYPADRLAYMVQDSGIGLLLTRSDARARTPSCHGMQVLEIDVLELGAQPAHDPCVAINPGQLAYVIYTSGSTGRPKGAQLSHRNLARLLAGTEPWFRFGPDDIWTMFHSFAFDFSVWEIFGALCTGGRLVIVPFWTSRSPDDFLALLRAQRVTVLNQTPSAFRPLIHAAVQAGAGDPLALRCVIFGGEALEPESLRPWIERFGDAQPRLVNMYGITETTVHVSYRPITRDDLAQSRRSPMGVAIPDLGLRVLDGDLNLLPAGLPGELHVAGAGLARGYRQRAGLSAERFVADPLDARGGRLYRTGDLARWGADGQLEYLGRADHQVKLRGFRIELGEIEAQLLAWPPVKEAAVLVASEGASEAQLVAYVTVHAGRDADVGALKNRLAQVLPAYMVPSAIMVLEVLPLNANGKLDRRALPAPVAVRQHPYKAPRGHVAEALAAIWSEVLGMEQVGADDNFFDLGGHSLQLIRMHRLVEERLAAGLTVVDLFKFPSIAALCRRIEQGAAAPGAAEQREEQRVLRQRAALQQRRPSREKAN
ncbi:amino acid adenylation domain-containing protein [Variovorax sp. DT-64]|uniref:amino acid adenylation domain-containing protein n=1 Tax=Variovorax sp. DT-64 TaxID=3396160 RepID=UPI003F19C487